LRDSDAALKPAKTNTERIIPILSNFVVFIRPPFAIED
jgi:hypothetical protein